ncbi:MAG: hypothetical protein AB8B56_01005 [Crocinitomicaceae bacterium]
MDQQLDDDFTLSEDTSVVEKKRPGFLTVLCILTFVGSGFGIISGLIGFTGYNSVESQLNNASIGNPLAQEMFNNLDVARIQALQDWANILGLIASILCLAGALIMFNMKKIGFFSYVLGQAVSVYAAYVGISIINEMKAIMPIAQMGDMMSMIGGVAMVFAILIAIAFVIMYGVNFKHLK